MRYHTNLDARSQFCLLMYDTEPLKPSNTGKLIADVLPDTQAFLWSRTEPDDALLTLLKDDTRQPYLIFPQAYATPPRQVFSDVPEKTKPPLFILLDGTWPEARKMFRKSPYLDGIPLLSINDLAQKDYLLRVAAGRSALHRRSGCRRTDDGRGYRSRKTAAGSLHLLPPSVFEG